MVRDFRLQWGHVCLAGALALGGCATEDDAGGDAGAGGSGAAGGSSAGGGGAGGLGGLGGTPAGGASAGGAVVCALVHITPSPGLDTCFDCMVRACCLPLQTCDGDERCLACLADPVNNTDACTEETPEAFQTYGPFADLATCQTERCVPPCGVSGDTTCTPGDCPPSCAGYASACER